MYAARHQTLGHAVAIKQLFAHYARIAEIRQRFLDEAQIQARLRHPNLVAVFDIVDEGPRVATVMEFIDGCSLATFIDEHHPVDQELAHGLALGMLNGLSVAHREGIVHRDIKPENVLLARQDESWIPKISDFGIAKVLTADKRTRTGTKMGTVQYMAPEQVVDSSSVDARADVYSMGVTLYELFTGRLPFRSDNVYALMQMHREAVVPEPTALRPDLSTAVAAIILKALEKDPDDRYPSAVEMLEALRHLDVKAPPPLPPIALGLGQGGPVGGDPPSPAAALGAPLRSGGVGAVAAALGTQTTLDAPAVPPGFATSASRPAAPGEYRPLSGQSPRIPPPPPMPELDREPPRPPPRPRPRPQSGTEFTISATHSAPAVTRRRLDVSRWVRLALVVTVLLVGYQLFPTAQCLYEVTDAQALGSRNDAEFNPGNYSWLDPNSARLVGQTRGLGEALSLGAPICWRRAGFGAGHPVAVNLLLSLSFAGLVVLLVLSRMAVGRETRREAAAAEPDTPALDFRPPRRPRSRAPISAPGSEAAEPGGYLDAIDGERNLPRDSDLYLRLTTHRLSRAQLAQVSVSAAVRCADGLVVRLWPRSQPLSALVASVPTTDRFAAVSFVIPYRDVRHALEREGRDYADSRAVAVRLDFENETASFSTTLT